ncbi:protein of unknown function [Clostridium beijerinckii]|nr:protein of unknown function [Clostridium beijerinckii]
MAIRNTNLIIILMLSHSTKYISIIAAHNFYEAANKLWSVLLYG